MSSEANDIRVLVSLPDHPKTKRLIRRLGPGAGWFLIRLWLWARDNRPSGDLTGMTSEDIELAIDWNGENDAFVATLADVRLLEGEEGAYRLHDWADHNPWSTGSEMRSLKAKWNAVKRHHGAHEADRQVPEYARIRAASTETDAASTGSDAASNAVSTDPAVLGAARSNAPSPSSLPSPSPSSSPSPEASSLREESSPPLALDGDPPPPADLPTRKAQRIRQIGEEAQEAYNRILGKPTGLLSRCAVLNAPRLKAVEKALQTARPICQQLYGNERVTPDFWQALFETAADDGFCSGKGPYGNGHEGWRPDFEYLLREEVIAKLFDRAMTEAAA